MKARETPNRFNWRGRRKGFASDSEYVLIPADSVLTNFSVENCRPKESISTKLGAWSQIGMLLLVAFGYLYTVRPVFQYQLLQEQTAKLELEKIETKKHLTQLNMAKSEAEKDLALLREALDREKDERNKLVTQLMDTRSKEELAKKRAQDIETKVTKDLKALEVARWELLIIDFRFAYFRSVWSGSDLYSSKRMDENILAQKISWPRPYEDLHATLDKVRKDESGEQQFPKSYFDELGAYIEARKSDLSCEKTDFDFLAKQYLKDLADLDIVVDSELKELIDGVIEGYEKNGESVVITDKYKESARKDIMMGKKFGLDRRYGDDISKLRDSCWKRGLELIREFGRYKAVTR